MKKWICLCLSMLLMQHAAALPTMGAVHAKSAALYDSTGQMLYEYNAEQPLQPASVTKIMTMLLAIEAVDSGKAQWSDLVTASAYAASMGGTQIWLKVGEQLSLDEMMKAIAVGSANDCAVAVAEHLAGTEDAFVEQMNTRAKALGCTSTTFINANGLDADGEKTLTSARDLALISVELLRHPKILDYTTIWMDSVRNGEFQLANTNKMLRSYDGLIGLKTGYISQAGFCISAAAEREGLTLIATVMGAPTKEDRMADATALLNYGYANYRLYTPDLSALPESLPVIMGKETAVSPVIEGADSIVVEKERADALQIRIELPEKLEAPIVEGQRIGQLKVLDGTQERMCLPITAGATIQRMDFFDIFGTFVKLVLMKQGA